MKVKLADTRVCHVRTHGAHRDHMPQQDSEADNSWSVFMYTGQLINDMACSRLMATGLPRHSFVDVAEVDMAGQI